MLRFADRLLFNADYIHWVLSRTLKLSADSYCDLETTEGDRLFVSNDGSVCSMLRIHGNRRMMGETEFEQLSVRLAELLQAQMNSGNHALQFVFMSDPGRSETQRMLECACADALASMKRMELDLRDLWERKVDLLAQNYCRREELFLILWTSPQGLSFMERREAERARSSGCSPSGAFSPRFTAAAEAIRNAHLSFVSAVAHDLCAAGLILEDCETHSALRICRSLLDPAHTDERWQARLPGDPIDARYPDCEEESDPSCLLWPRISDQLFPSSLKVLDPRCVQIAGRIYATVSVEIGPSKVMPFDAFLCRWKERPAPWIMSMRLSSDGFRQVAHKMLLAKLLSFTHSSKVIRASLEKAREKVEAGEVFLGMQLQFCTWAKASQRLLLDERAARLSRAVQAWGGMETRVNNGNPIEALHATMPMLLHRSSANASAIPVEDAARLLPLSRPSSPWESGAFFFRTPDGKLFPYQPCSARQKAWITLIYAPMGGGKSVLLNALNTALALAAGNQRLPRIGILDIGISSAGMISLLKEALPPHRRHEVLYVRMQNTPSFAINPMDTPLGCRYPLPAHRSFLVHFLTLLATPVGEKKPYEAIPGIANMVIDEAYRAAADDGMAVKLYQKAFDPDVDRQLEMHGFVPDAQTSWWEAVDWLFDRGAIHTASLAQRHAVPHIGEIAALVREPGMRSIYAGTVPMGGEGILDYFYRAVTDAVRTWRVLSGPTRFATQARIVSLDLDEVALRGNADAQRQTAVMYMLGRHVVCGDMYLRKEHLHAAPESYRVWHAQNIERMENDPKRICFDEFHRTEGVEAVRRQVLLDIREGRKWKVEVILASQRLEDFDDSIIDLATTAFILGVGSQSLEKTVQVFHLPDAARAALRNLGNPGRSGARLLAWFDTSAGRFTHQLVNTLSGEEVWAYSTTREDVSVRQALYARMPPAEARRALVQRYPAGTLKPEYERRRTLLEEQGGYFKEQADEDLVRMLTDEVYDSYQAFLQSSRSIS
ncbi:MAG: type IV secretion protein IcmB [Candidatus Eutrophobiaceae bacterium]